MSLSHTMDGAACDGRCEVCATSSSVPGPAGWRLVGAAATVFLLPLVAAAAGARLGAGGLTRQTLAALGGGALGVALARVIARGLIRPQDEKA